MNGVREGGCLEHGRPLASNREGMSLPGHWWRLSAVGLAATTLVTGCIFQQEPRVVTGDPYPDPHVPTAQETREVGAPSATVTTSPTSIDVTLSQPRECREQARYVRDVETKRSANVLEQVGNATGFLALGGVGIAFLASPCTATPSATASDPNPQSRPCTSDEQTKTDAIAGTLIGLGVLSGAAFVYNMIRAQDSKETMPADSPPAAWRACDPAPIANAPMSLVLGDGQQLSQTTDSTGRAHFDLAGVRWTDAALASGHAQLQRPDRQMQAIDLTGLPQYASWSEARARQVTGDAWAKARVEQREATVRSLDGAEASIAILEHAKEPWGDDDIQRMGNTADVVNRARTQMPTGDPLNPRLTSDYQRLMRLKPAFERSMAVGKKRHEAVDAMIANAMRAAAQSGPPPSGGATEEDRRSRAVSDCRTHCNYASNECNAACVGGDYQCHHMCNAQEETCRANCER